MNARIWYFQFPGFFSLGFVRRQGPTREQMDRFKFSFALVGRGWKCERDLECDATMTTIAIDEGQTQTQSQNQNQIPEGEPNETLIVKVDGVNPAYGLTNICLLQAALTILEESDRMPSSGGVYTPGEIGRAHV